jgi:hypothetical protein
MPPLDCPPLGCGFVRGSVRPGGGCEAEAAAGEIAGLSVDGEAEREQSRTMQGVDTLGRWVGSSEGGAECQ